MNAEQIKRTRNILHISSQEMAKALAVAPVTVLRWETGKTIPTGLQAEVLQGLYNVALAAQQHQEEDYVEKIRGRILLGIGALLFHSLSSAP